MSKSVPFYDIWSWKWSSLEIIVFSPRSKFRGSKRTARRGQEDGEKKMENFFFKGPNFSVEKGPFFYFLENFQKMQFWSANFSVKTAPREKTEYTTTKGTENARKLSSQIFYFQTFVTEIFGFKVCHFSHFLKTSKNAIFDKFGGHIVDTSITLRSKLIGANRSSVCALQSWFYSFWS